jgi:hypothetical protein
MLEVQVGSTITNGSSCIRVTERVEKDPRWGTAGWRGMAIPLEAFGGNAGTSEFVPDYLLTGWYHVPFEWRPCIGGGVEERYVWSADWRRLQREVRRTPDVMPTVDGIRGHRITTAEEDEVARRFALEAPPLETIWNLEMDGGLLDVPAISTERGGMATGEEG